MAAKTVAQKLLIKDGFRIHLARAPEGYERTLGELPDGARIMNTTDGAFDLVQIFVTSKNELERELKTAAGMIRTGCLLWVSYPKGTAQTKTDISRDVIRAYAPSVGLRAVALISVDDTWSAMRLMPA